MTTMLLKAISVNAKNETKESQLGVVSPQGSNSRLSLKAKPGTLYRLVDEKTGEVIKSQILVRKGQKLQAIVDKSVVVGGQHRHGSNQREQHQCLNQRRFDPLQLICRAIDHQCHSSQRCAGGQRFCHIDCGQ